MKFNKKTILMSGLLIGTLFLSTNVFAEDVQTETTMTTEAVLSTAAQEETSATLEESTETTTDSSVVEVLRVKADEVEAEMNKIIGEKIGEDVPLETTPESSQIRKELLSMDYGISKEELDKYTDEQLENTMTLFTRYNYDITGMDYGMYARLLNTLYVDKTVNVNDALTQLSFDPASFSSFSAMIPQVEQLQVYLKTLYPINSTFIRGIERTNDELIAKLEALQKMEDELTASGEPLPFGRIAPLLQNYTNNQGAVETTTTTESSTTDSSQGATSTPTTSDKKESGLPQTGEKNQTMIFTVVGVLALVVVGFVFIKKAKKN